MEKLFGVPMDSILVVMLGLLSVFLVLVAFIAWRRPVIFKLGVRNIPRRKTQTSLIIVGLMLATLIMSAALATGDTMNHSVDSAVYDLLGPVDEMVVASHDGSGEGSVESVFMETMPESNVDTVRHLLDGAEVDAVGGALVTMAPVLNMGGVAAIDMDPGAIAEAATASNPRVPIVAMSQDFLDQVGGLNDVDGIPVEVSTLGGGEVYISEAAADDLGLEAGDQIAYFLDNQPHAAVVRAVIPSSILAGGLQPNQPSMLVGLDHLQQVTGTEGQVSVIFVSNTGGAKEGLAHSDAVSGTLEAGLGSEDMGVVPIKQLNADNAEMTASVFVTMFVVFGLFSIAVGILLIVLIFTMLAAERRAEMGMARAVGAQRRQLVQQFISEGAGYTLTAGLVGTTLGIGAAWFISRGMATLTGGDFSLDLYVHPRSLMIAYSLGVVITFLAVVLSSWRVSKLNVVAAIRDIPEVYRAKKQRAQLLWGSFAMLLGTLVTVLGWANGSGTLFLLGTTILPFGVAAILAYVGANTRVVLTIVGLLVIVWWLMPTDTFSAIFGEDRFDAGGLELFFISGISIVAAATLVMMQNMELILKAAHALGRRFQDVLPAARVGLAYPRANKGRAGMTIAMFALIVFSIVVMGTMNSIFSQAMLVDDANAGMQVRVDVPMANPIDDFPATLERAGIDSTQLSTPARVDALGSALDQQLVEDSGEQDWQSGFLVNGMDATYLDETQLRFGARATGYESDEAIREALKTEPYVMVIPADAATQSDDSAAYSTSAVAYGFDGIPSEGVFEPVQVQMRGSAGVPVTMTIIGVLDADYFMLTGYSVGMPTVDELIPTSQPRFTSYFMTTADGVDPSTIAADIERELLPYGVQGVDIEQEMKDNQQQQNTMMTVMQGFMGLGMIVGVAAVGVIAYRAVVERRQQIGMLRALGFPSSTVAGAFVIETAVVVVLGSLSGAILGLILSYNLVNDPATTGGVGGIEFQVPWASVLVTVSVAIIAALAMAWFPARQASRVLPAEALRYE